MKALAYGAVICAFLGGCSATITDIALGGDGSGKSAVMQSASHAH